MNVDMLPGDFNSKLLYKALQEKEFKLQRIPQTSFILLKKKSKQGFLQELISPAMSYPAGWITSDKFYTKQYLAFHKIPVPMGEVFPTSEQKEALEYAKDLGFPVVAKPTNLSHGEYVYANIDSPKELEEKLHFLHEERAGNGYVLIEKHISGNEYRLVITTEGFFAAVLREPASIRGDGRQSIRTLIQKENYRRMNPRINCLCEIKLDDILFDYLAKKRMSINAVPKDGEQIQLRPTSNVSKGGNCVDVTDVVHPSIRSFAKKILKLFPRLPIVGIDLICEDIHSPLASQIHAVCELNASPGLSLHELPAEGKKRRVSAALAQVISTTYA